MCVCVCDNPNLSRESCARTTIFFAQEQGARNPCMSVLANKDQTLWGCTAFGLSGMTFLVLLLQVPSAFCHDVLMLSISEEVKPSSSALTGVPRLYLYRMLNSTFNIHSHHILDLEGYKFPKSDKPTNQ